jgi:hypothetical protein
MDVLFYLLKFSLQRSIGAEREINLESQFLSLEP